MHLKLAGGSLWRKQISVCGNKRAPVEYVILFFVFRGLCFWSVSIMKLFKRCADPCQRFWHQMTHTAYALGGEHARSVLEGMECVHCEPFSLGKAPLSFVPFLERIGTIICPPRLRSSRCWGSEETEFAAIADGACERVWERNFLSRARQRLTRVNCGRKMYCLLHPLFQQEVLCWLMVGWWRRRGYFWAFSACLPRDVELLEVMKHALLLGRPTVEARKRGSGSQ